MDKIKQRQAIEDWLLINGYIWYRRPCGTYPKWIGRFVQKVGKFFFKKRFAAILRGRGSRKAAAKIAGVNPHCFTDTLPLKYAKKVAIYITLKRK